MADFDDLADSLEARCRWQRRENSVKPSNSKEVGRIDRTGPNPHERLIGSVGEGGNFLEAKHGDGVAELMKSYAQHGESNLAGTLWRLRTANKYVTIRSHMSNGPRTVRNEDSLSGVWRALSDPTRRSILDFLREGPRTTGELAAEFPHSRFAVMKHIAVLVSAGLVISRKDGRERWNYLNPVPLQHMYEHWVRPYEAVWARSMFRFKKAAEQSHPEKPMPAPADRTTAGVLRMELEIPIAAPRAEVWRMLTEEVHQWWPRDFYASAEPEAMRFDATLGGRLFEQSADGGGVVWYTVIGVTPGRSVDLAGHLTVAFGGPAQTLLRLSLRDEGDHTVLELSDAVVGNVGERTAATLEDGWRALFESGFKQFVETSCAA